MMSLSSDQYRLVADLILFKTSWIALVVFQSAGIVPALVIVAWKLITVNAGARSWLLVVMTFLLGICMDVAFILSGLYDFQVPGIPVWLIVLWASFALTMPRGFAFLQQLPPVGQAAAGCVGGCVGYGAGGLLQAVDFGQPWLLTMIIVGMLWGVFIPGVILLAGQVRALVDES